MCGKKILRPPYAQIVAPPLAAPLTPWMGGNPSADGKSSILGSEEPPPCRSDAIALVNIIKIFKLLEHRIRHCSGSREGRPCGADPQSCKHGTGAQSAAKLQGATPPERTTAARAHHSDAVTTSSTPPADELPDPTLYTRRDPGFPHPPAAGAAVGGGRNRRNAGGEVDRLARFRESPFTVAGEGEDSLDLSLH